MLTRRYLRASMTAAGLTGLLITSVAVDAQGLTQNRTAARTSSRPERPPLPAHALERPRARPGYEWMQGRWVWDRRQRDYVWSPGRWEPTNRRFRSGNPAMVFRGGQWQFEPGR